ncbi:carboxylesterase/lipase family protein [Streptomyces sp. NPDC050418]|uniref:carboxylesterase/lipase family protein n=1 Tax=Streptomyces sp. NPDC050418 TaxID=3365612 RepID=UPI0037B7BF69
MTIVATAHGKVRGTEENGVAVFRGIPYAAAPFGEHRFAAPAPVTPWSGVRDALAFGPTAPKLPYTPPLDALLPDPDIAGDDCLNLNVWTPAPGAGRLPVMVWIHGGSLRNGSAALDVYDGRAFARDGVVLVSLNYRLGIEGFGVFPDAPANLGLRDQIAALTWVRENIEAFGGDPENVTVFGESAGGISIAALLTSPHARGLFRRAVIQSGAPMALPRDKARRTTAAIAKRLAIPATARDFAAADRTALLAAQGDVTRGGNPLTGSAGFQPVIDGDVLPDDPARALAAGAAADIDLLLGTTSEEYRLWFLPSGVADRIGRLTLRLALAKFRIPQRAARLYAAGRPGANPGEVLGAIATDKLLRIPLYRLADARTAGPTSAHAPTAGRTYLYEFAWRTRVQRLGACHALELGFVFDTLDTDEARALTGPDAPQPLADAMHRAWVAFATTGDPGWRGWDAARPVMTFDADGTEVTEAPREAERALWD